MMRIMSTIILFIALTGCSATVGEWNHGTKAKGYRSHDVCTICGEQIKWFEHDPNGVEKQLQDLDYYNNPDVIINY